jgi:hypothetical protein
MILIPDEFKKPHDACTHNMEAIEHSEIAACFHCLRFFNASGVSEYIDEGKDSPGTAICPLCHIDCVLPDSAGFPMEQNFIEIMGGFWFSADPIGDNHKSKIEYWINNLRKAGYMKDDGS